MNKSDIHSFDKDLPTFSTEEPNKKDVYNVKKPAHQEMNWGFLLFRVHTHIKRD